MRPKPMILIILDGYGVAPSGPGNAITNAKTPNMDRYWRMYPHCYLQASGSNVGLPNGTIGNSEVGHINIGAGRIVYQDLPRINNSITNLSFYNNTEFIAAANHVKTNKSRLHLMGLFSSGNVHASLEHIYALIKFAKMQNLNADQLFIHAFTDGRDSAPNSSPNFFSQIEDEINKRDIGFIVSVCGRYLSMDRNNRWDRIEVAYKGLTEGSSLVFDNVNDAIKDAYEKDETDEFINPRSIKYNNEIVKIQDNDAVIFFNYRADRAIQLTRAFVDEDFKCFDRKRKLQNLKFVTMTQYDKTIQNVQIAFPPEDVNMPIGRIFSDRGMLQYRIAETEKYAHVTYFFNGGRDVKFAGEERELIPSPKVATYDLKPEMSAREITTRVNLKIQMGIYDFILINFANADMVGHTGNLTQTIKAIEVLDECIGKIVKNASSMGGGVLITADHGNAEVMIDPKTGDPNTEHTTNPVPFIIAVPGYAARELPVGLLADVAPTLLSIMEIKIPTTMTGRNVLENVPRTSSSFNSYQ